jgi:hypothetical protein
MFGSCEQVREATGLPDLEVSLISTSAKMN